MKPETDLGVLAAAIHRDTYGDDPAHQDTPCGCQWWQRDVQEAQRLITDLAHFGAHVAFDVHLPKEAPVRKGGPSVSQVAARSIRDMSERHLAVLDVARSFADGWTLDDLAGSYLSSAKHYPIPQQTKSSVRSRAAELERAGWLEVIGEGRSKHGRPARTWRVARRVSEVEAA